MAATEQIQRFSREECVAAMRDQGLFRRPITLLNLDLPPALERAICACLAPDPDARPHSMVEVGTLRPDSAGRNDRTVRASRRSGRGSIPPGIRSAARRLAELAVPALPDGRGIAWPRTEGGRLNSAFWCHGAGGIGHFFLHAARRNLIPEAEELAHRAARTVDGSTRWALPTLCHGLAGNLAFLLEMHRQTGDPTYPAGAHSFDRLLRTCLVEHRGSLVCPGNEPASFSPTYTLGYAGVAMVFLQLAVPGDLPDLARPSRCQSIVRSQV